MATLYLAEFGAPKGDYNIALLGTAGPVAEQTVAISSVSVAVSSAFQADSYMVRVHADAICSVAFSSNPTATTSNMRFVAGQTEYFGIPPSGLLKIAVITNT